MYPSEAIKIGGSKLTTNVALSEITDVYLPDLGKEGDKAYFDTIEGGGPRIDGGSHEPFYFEIMYSPIKDKNLVHIHATMSGENPVFYIVLPPSVKSVDDLKTFISNEYIANIAKLVNFGSVLSKSKIDANDTQLAEFITDNKIAQRGQITIQAEKIATIEFDAIGDLKSVLPSVAICLGQGEAVATCYQSAAE